MAAYLRAQGVAAEQIMIEDRSRDSCSNLEQIRKKTLALRGDTVGLVSSPHHLLRIRALNLPAAAGFRELPYSPTRCDPPLTRTEIWRSAHGNLAAWLASILLPSKVYERIVLWVRTHTAL